MKRIDLYGTSHLHTAINTLERGIKPHADMYLNHFLNEIIEISEWADKNRDSEIKYHLELTKNACEKLRIILNQDPNSDIDFHLAKILASFIVYKKEELNDFIKEINAGEYQG